MFLGVKGFFRGENTIKGVKHMPRSARQISNTKVYHIILRGNDKQDIFYDEQDYKKFIKEIQETKEKYQYKVLTDNKNNIRKKYNITTIDKPSIESIMLFYIKGEK